jgi:hypothetical protein
MAIPATGYAAGTSLFLFRQGSFLVGPGQFVQSWELVDRATVGSDGLAHTTSPPYAGGITEGAYFLGGNSDLAELVVTNMYSDARIEVISGAQPYCYQPSSVFDNRLPLPLDATSVRLWRVAPDGKATYNSGPLSGLEKGKVVSLNLEVDEPTLEDKRPALRNVTVSIINGKPTVTIEASDFHTDDPDLLRVVFHDENMHLRLKEPDHGGYVVAAGPIQNNTIQVQVPSSLPLGHLVLRVENLVTRYEFQPGADPQQVSDWVESNPRAPEYQVPYLVWVANISSNTVSAIDPRAANGPKSVAEIPVGLAPSDVVVSPDGLRVFVSNSGEGTISIIDTLTLKEIDVDPSSPGLDRIKLNEGNSQPWFMALDPDTGWLYISERTGPYVYGVTTKADDFHYRGFMKVGGTERLTGLTGIAVTAADPKTGNRYLSVATPGEKDHWYGGDFGFDPRYPGYLYYGLLVDGGNNGIWVQSFQRLEAGYKPFGVTAGKSPYEVAVAVRGSDVIGMAVFNLKEGKLSHNVVMDMERAIEIRKAFGRSKETLKTTTIGAIIQVLIPGGMTAIEMTMSHTWNAKTYFDINNIESVVFTKDYKYAFVVGNATFNGDTDFTRDPYLGHGGNIGVVRDPLDPARAKLIGVTEEWPMSWPDEITIDPTNIYLMAAFKGLNPDSGSDQLGKSGSGRVVYYNISDLKLAAETMDKAYAAEGKKIDKTIDQYVKDGGKLKLEKGLIKADARPSGIAASPEAPTDFIAQTAAFIEGGTDTFSNPVIQLNYLITGVIPDRPLTIQIWEASAPSLDGAASKTFVKEWEPLRGDKWLSVGSHQVNLPLLKGLRASQTTWYIVKLDTNDDFTEFSENNNAASFRIPVADLTAKYDADPLDLEFGRYIYGVPLLNEFELRLQKDIVTSSTVVKITLGNQELSPQKVNDYLYRFTRDMADIPENTGLTYKVMNGETVVLEKTYLIHTFSLPNWINPKLYEGDANEIRTVEWIDALNAYWVQAIDLVYTWQTAIPKPVVMLGGSVLSLNYGAYLSLAFNLKGEAIYQDAGPTFRLTLFGVDMGYLNVPALSLLKALGKDELEIPFESLEEFFVNLIEASVEAASSSPEAAKVASWLAGSVYGVASDKVGSFYKSLTGGDDDDDDDDDNSLLSSDDDEAARLALALGQDPGDKEDDADEGGLKYALSVKATPFVVDNRLILKAGEISIKGSIEKDLGEIKEEYNIPPIGTLLQFEVEATLGLSLKVEVATGLKAVSGDLVPSNDVLKITATGTLEASGKANLALGITGVSVTAEASLGIELAWTGTDTVPTLTFPLSLGVKIEAQVFWELYTQDVFECKIFETPDVFEGPYTFIPVEIPARRPSGGIDDEAAGNNDFAHADELGIVAGSYENPYLALQNRYDRDYYRFRTIDAAAPDSDVHLSFPEFTNADPQVSGVLLNESGAVVSEMAFTADHSGILSLAGLPAGQYVLAVWGHDDAPTYIPVGYGVRINAPQTATAALVASMSVAGTPKVMEAGRVLDVTVKVVNAGGAAAPSAEGALVWSRDGLIDPGDGLLLPSFMVPALAPGQSWEKTFSVVLPNSVIGPVYIGFAADRRQTVTEAYRGDNEVTYAVEAALAADAYENNNLIYKATPLGGLVAGREITGLNLASLKDKDIFAFELAETGTAADNLAVWRSDEAGPVGLLLKDGDDVFVRRGIMDETAGVSRLALEGLPAGRYFLSVVPVNEAGFEYRLVVESQVRTKANLAVQEVDAGYELLPGDTAHTARVLVSNYGATAAHSFDISVLLTEGGITSAIGSGTVGVLGAGQTTIVEVPLSIPAGLTVGATVQVTARVDTTESVAELNEVDNETTLPALVVGSPDTQEAAEYVAGGYIDLGVVRGGTNGYNRNLHSIYDQDLMSLGLSGTGIAGDEIRLTFDEATGVISVALYDAGMVFVAGGQKSAAGDYRISLEGRTGGAYYIIVRDSGQPRTGTENQAYTLTIKAPDADGPNLTPTGLSLASVLVADGSANVTATVKNIGDAASGDFTGAYYLSTDKIIDANDTPLATVNFTALAAGTEATDSRALDLSGVASGTYYLGLLADDGNLATEPVETDNVRIAPLVVLPASDARESNDSLKTASVVTLSGGGASVTGLNLHNSEDMDFFRFALSQSAGTTDIARITYRTQEPFLLFSLLDASGNVMYSVIGSNGIAALSLNGLAGGVYFLKVDGAQDFSFSTGYALSMTVAGAA